MYATRNRNAIKYIIQKKYIKAKGRNLMNVNQEFISAVKYFVDGSRCNLTCIVSKALKIISWHSIAHVSQWGRTFCHFYENYIIASRRDTRAIYEEIGGWIEVAFSLVSPGPTDTYDLPSRTK